MDIQIVPSSLATSVRPPDTLLSDLATGDRGGFAEVPAVTTQASGSGFVTLIGNIMFYDIDYDGLSAGATAAHIHGPADATHTAGVLIPFSGASGTSGTLFGQSPLTPEQLTNLLAGLTYINIHTSVNPGGEIRGQIILQY